MVAKKRGGREDRMRAVQARGRNRKRWLSSSKAEDKTALTTSMDPSVCLLCVCFVCACVVCVEGGAWDLKRGKNGRSGWLRCPPHAPSFALSLPPFFHAHHRTPSFSPIYLLTYTIHTTTTTQASFYRLKTLPPVDFSQGKKERQAARRKA